MSSSKNFGPNAYNAEHGIGRTTDTLLGSSEIDARLKLRYRGKSTKRQVSSNVNYFDHNILGLENREQSETASEYPENQRNKSPICFR